MQRRTVNLPKVEECESCSWQLAARAEAKDAFRQTLQEDTIGQLDNS